MNGIPGYQSNIANSIPVGNIVFDDLVSQLRINLDDSHITLLQQLNPGFQPSDMLIGPMDFRTSLLEDCHGAQL
jgi:hypothetical protein